MKITKKALKRIRQIKNQRNLPEKTGLRLGLGEGVVFLEWDAEGPRADDLVMIKEGLQVLIDPGLYLRLADYTLDFDSKDGSPFLQFNMNRRAAKSTAFGAKIKH